MKASKYYDVIVPCLTEYRTETIKYASKNNMYISPECTIRYNQDGVTILTDWTNIIHGDNYLAKLLSNDKVNLENIDPKIIKLLVDSGILIDESRGLPIRKKYNNSILPVVANLEITQMCNAKCVHCYCGSERGRKEPSLEQIVKRIEKLANLGIQYIKVIGGEPLLRNDLDKITTFINSKKIKYSVLTNGYYLKEKLPELINVDAVYISIDGNAETHNKIRGGDYFSKALNALEILKNSNINRYIGMTVHDFNYEHVNLVREIAREYGAKLILQATLSTNFAEQNSLKYNDSLKNENYHQIEELFTSINKPKCIINSEPSIYGCDMGRKTITVNSLGKVLPCIYIRDFDIGNIEEFNAEKYNNVIDYLRKKRLTYLNNCNKCKDNRCGGPCIFSKTHNNWRIQTETKEMSATEFCVSFLT